MSLREMEKKIQADHFEQIATNGGNMTVLELVENIHQQKPVSDLLQLQDTEQLSIY